MLSTVVLMMLCGVCAVLKDTEAGRSIFKVRAVDKDLGSGGSVTYFLQVRL